MQFTCNARKNNEIFKTVFWFLEDIKSIPELIFYSEK